MNSRERTRRGSAAWLATGLVGLAIVVAGCGSDPQARAAAGHAHHHSAPSAATLGADTLEVTADDFAFTTSHATVAAGRVRIRLRNRGGEAHQVQVGRTKRPLTPEQFVDLFHREGDLASVRALTWVGGVSVIDPGAEGAATVDLVPGDYLLVCYVPTADGTSHVMKGMVAPLHVSDSGAATPAADRPRAAEAVTLRDYAIDLPQGFRGRGEVVFRNQGAEPHEVVFMRLKDGKTLADAVAYQPDTGRPAPFTFAGGVASIAPGSQATATLDLRPGDYIATCFVPGPGGAQHVAMGMVSTFTVG